MNLFSDEDKGMWKRRSWYEEEAKNMMQKTQEDLKQIEELYSSKSGGKILLINLIITESFAISVICLKNKTMLNIICSLGKYKSKCYNYIQ